MMYGHTVKMTLQNAVKSVIAGLKLVHFSDQIQTDNTIAMIGPGSEFSPESGQPKVD